MKSSNWKIHGKEKEKPLPWFAQGYIKEKQARDVVTALSEMDGKSSPNSTPIKKKGRGKKEPKSQSLAKEDPVELHRFVIPRTQKERSNLIKAIRATKDLREKKIESTNTESDFPRAQFSEFYFERPNGDNNWNVTATSWKMFESTIPYDDPYHMKKREAVLTGLDFRYIGRQPIDSDRKSAFWPMTLDLGMQIKPLIKVADNFSFVVETRYLNSPTTQDLDYITTSGVRNRSSYVMIDDMFYNTFIMYGMYKPMFEHYTPDHTTLAQKMLYDKPFDVLNKAFSIGLAPNVPFANLHFIQPMANSGYNQEEGVVLNLGARWVTLGASLVYSYRSVKDTAQGDAATVAHSLSGGMMWKRLILNTEFLNVTRDRIGASGQDSGSVMTLEARYKLWKESYIETVTEFSNIGVGLNGSNLQRMGRGHASQVSLGFRYFPAAGIDLSAFFRKTTETPEDKILKAFNNSEGILQAHFYF